MKTSFYFVLWIVIYPVLGLINNRFINDNSFIVALAIVWSLSWLLNRLMPKTHMYERHLQETPIMEDVYMDNISAFIKRLKSDFRIEFLTSIYFLISTCVIACVGFKLGVNDCFALIVFGFLAFISISRVLKLNKALGAVKSEPTAEKCAEIASELYQLDYPAYYEDRQEYSFEQMFPPRPKHFKLFQILSIIIAGICGILGLIFIVSAGILMLTETSISSDAIAGMCLLYGTLAIYYGIKDFITTIRAIKTTNKKNYQIKMA